MELRPAARGDHHPVEGKAAGASSTPNLFSAMTIDQIQA